MSSPGRTPARKTLRARMVQHLVDVGCDSISGLARAMQTSSQNIYSKLNVSLRYQHVTDQHVEEINPITNVPMRVHKVYATERGKDWLATLPP